jgi:hypothetical protein
MMNYENALVYLIFVFHTVYICAIACGGMLNEILKKIKIIK